LHSLAVLAGARSRLSVTDAEFDLSMMAARYEVADRMTSLLFDPPPGWTK